MSTIYHILRLFYLVVGPVNPQIIEVVVFVLLFVFVCLSKFVKGMN